VNEQDKMYVIAGILLIVTTFVFLNVNKDVGTVYSIFSLIYFVTVMSKKGFVPIIIKGQDITKSTFTAGALLVAWLVITSILTTYVQPNVALGTFSLVNLEIFKQLHKFTQLPVLSDDPNIALGVWGVAIPVIEGVAFTSFMLLLYCKIAGIEFRWHSINSPQFIKMLIVCAMVGASGSVFHLSARMLNDWALLVDFIYFFISALVVFKFKRLLEVIELHVFINSLLILIGA